MVFLLNLHGKQPFPANSFTQCEPLEGAPATEKTEVKILYDEKNIYVGVTCYDSEPDNIIHNELEFDGDLANDDNFTMVIDTFNDRRTGFFFKINPNGARQDALIKDKVKTYKQWDGIWDVAARITDYGWSAEMVIPFATLRFPDVEIQNWSINFSRDIKHKNEEVLWTAWRRDDSIQMVSKAGRLAGICNIKRGKKTEFIPYVLGGAEKQLKEEIDDTFKYGIDVKYPLRADLTLDFTTKTDFAQVEVDEETINLTRFNLNYPEKRDFFLEGADIFDYTTIESDLYYSRRIGITPGSDREQGTPFSVDLNCRVSRVRTVSV